MGLKLSGDDEPPLPRYGPANALQELEHLELKLFCDFKGAPRISLPGDPPATSWPIRHSRVDEWLAAWYFRFCNHVLNKWERERILAVLCGQAQAAPASSPSDAELWIEFEREPVALEVQQDPSSALRRTCEWPFLAGFLSSPLFVNDRTKSLRRDVSRDTPLRIVVPQGLLRQRRGGRIWV